ncbi:MAG: sigma-54-dependent Fis family transcriptional regulator [Gammaproteobacteria bacterium]|nr:sigma-54-dependent Fis family transcriptional regulator [Gammaproteobacteria bacterium]
MSKEKHIALIVDDEPDIRELLDITLSRMGIETKCAENITQAKDLLSHQNFDLCLTDMRLPDGNGIGLIKYIQENISSLPVAMITAHGNMEFAIEALKSGAFDFVSKPVDITVLRNLVNTALKLSATHTDDKQQPQYGLLGKSSAIEETRKKIKKLSRSQAPVYIHGESGVGKELVAKLIHEHGPRADHNFVPVNCGAIPAELMESEFFGHKKGSFTGASTDKQGLFQAADGGTLFLDEIADLPLAMQVKLLRAIQEKAVRPIGSQQEIPVNVRILSATHKNLAELTEKAEFRQDLYYRINVIELEVPSLRERPEDISILSRYFLQKIASEWQTEIPELNDESLKALNEYSFHGNVRELENILERAMTLHEDKVITREDLQLPNASSKNNISGKKDDISLDQNLLDPTLLQKEKEVIERALEKTKYNKTAAAKLLGISFRALRYRIKKLGID